MHDVTIKINLANSEKMTTNYIMHKLHVCINNKSQVLEAQSTINGGVTMHLQE